jgi:hypothetical protein
VRKHFQESTFASAVEHMTGRRVIAFSAKRISTPPFSVEFFRLAPAERLPGRPGDAVSRG